MMARDQIGVFEAEVLRAAMGAGGDAYGLSIARSIEAEAGRTVSVGAVYTVLDRLEQKGFVSSRWGEATAVRGGRRKRLYVVSARGQAALSPQHKVDGASNGVRGAVPAGAVG